MLTTTSTLLLEGLRGPANDEAAWRIFDERYRPILASFARRLGVDDEAAAEIAQDTLVGFIEEYRSGRYDRDRGRLRSWLFSMARRRVAAALRSRARTLGWRGDSALDDIAGRDEFDRCWQEEWRDAVIREALRHLREETGIDPSTLSAFEMVTLEERPASRVAEALGMSLDAVHQARHRCLARLRIVLADLERDY